MATSVFLPNHMNVVKKNKKPNFFLLENPQCQSEQNFVNFVAISSKGNELKSLRKERLSKLSTEAEETGRESFEGDDFPFSEMAKD